MEQVASEEDEIDLCFSADLQDLPEGVDGVLASNGIFLGIADVVVCGQEDAEAARGSIQGKGKGEISSALRCGGEALKIARLTCRHLWRDMCHSVSTCCIYSSATDLAGRCSRSLQEGPPYR